MKSIKKFKVKLEENHSMIMMRTTSNLIPNKIELPKQLKYLEVPLNHSDLKSQIKLVLEYLEATVSYSMLIPQKILSQFSQLSRQSQFRAITIHKSITRKIFIHLDRKLLDFRMRLMQGNMKVAHQKEKVRWR